MSIEEILANEWFDEHQSVVLSTRIRLARNLDGYIVLSTKHYSEDEAAGQDHLIRPIPETEIEVEL